MNSEQKKLLIKQLEQCRETAKNNFEVCCETYTEINSLLYLIIKTITDDN